MVKLSLNRDEIDRKCACREVPAGRRRVPEPEQQVWEQPLPLRGPKPWALAGRCRSERKDSAKVLGGRRVADLGSPRDDDDAASIHLRLLLPASQPSLPDCSALCLRAFWRWRFSPAVSQE